MPSKEKKKASSSKTKSSSSSSSKKDSSKDKKKKSSKRSSKSKSKSPSRSRKSSATEEDEQPGPTATAAITAPSAMMPPSSAAQQDHKASSDFEAGLLFQRFARNGGVDAKDFQRMWREREIMSPITGTPFGGRRNSSEGEAAQQRRGQEGGRGGGGGIEPEKVFEFGQLFQQFDTDGDGRLDRADFERMLGGMLERLGGNHGGSRGNAGREAATNSSGVPPAPPPPTPPQPPPPSPPPVGPSITHYDETTGVPLAWEAVASQQALGHTVVPLGDAYSRRLSRLQSLASSRLMPVRERLLQLRRRFQGRSEEVRAAKAAIERETLADANAIVERLRSVEALKQATLVQGVNSVTAELEGVEKLSDQVARVTALPPSTPDAASPSSAYVPDFEETEKMVELVQSYRELCNSIDRVAGRPFTSNIDVKADDFPHETAERLEVLRRADRYEQALSVKDQMLWVAMQECQRLEAKCEEERSLGQEFAEEAQEWVKLTGKLSDRVNALTAETDQTSNLRKTNDSLVQKNQELLRRLETLERDAGSTMNGNAHETVVHDDQLHRYHPPQAGETVSAPQCTYPLPNGGGAPPTGEQGDPASPPHGSASRFFGCMRDGQRNRQLQQASERQSTRARDPSFRGHGQHDQHGHDHGTPRSLTGIAGDGRSPMSLGLRMSPPVGTIGAALTPPAVQNVQQEDQNISQQQSPPSPPGASLPPLGGVDDAGYLAEAAPVRDGQDQQRSQSAVGAVIAEVSARRSRRSAESQQSQGGDMDMDVDMDMDIAGRGTPRSASRQAMAQPRLLLSELDADVPGSAAGTEGAPVLGRRKTRDDCILQHGSRKISSDMATPAKEIGGGDGSGGAGAGGAGTPPSGDETEHRREEEEEEEMPRDILAICKHGNILGVAAYREPINAIDIQETHAFTSDMADTIEGIKLLVRPRLVLMDLYMATNQPLFEMLVAPLIEGADPIDFRLVKRASWDYQSAVRGICANLKVQNLKATISHDAGVGGATSRSDTQGRDGGLGGTGASGDPLKEAFNRLGSVIDFEGQQQVRALGALLVHLQSTVFALEESGSVNVTAVRQLDVYGSMRIDPMTLRSLGIMAEEFHPNVISGKGRSKEGFSVFGLFDQTKSALGRRCLKEWMLKPLYDIANITARQDSVGVLVKAENAEICRRLRSQLGKLHDITRIIMRIKKVASTFADWCKLIQSIEAALEVRDGLAILKTSADAAVVVEGSYGHQAFLARLLESMDSVVLRRCLEGLCEVIDPVASAQDKEVVIRYRFDEELDRMRDLLGDLPEILQRIGKIILNENALLEELSVEYVPQIGFLTALHERFSDLKPDDFSFAFSQGDTVYYKSPTMHDVDDGIGDIQGKITDKQAKIMRELEEALLEEEGAFHTAAAALAELDAALALAAVAADFGFVRPEVVEDNVIMIKNGRHPLQEHTVDHFIPNDTYIADGSRVALITGANCSGKSVYLKQVGVAVYLAHVGSFVPAEKAIIGLTDRIFTRIATVETSALPQSSFTIDVNQIAHMVRSSSPRSLLLIDEFGKGTAPADDIGLVVALLRHLSRAGRKCLFTLHFHEIFTLGLVKVQGPDDLRTDLQDVSVFRMNVHVPLMSKTADQQCDDLGGADPEDDPGGGNGMAPAPPIPLFKLVPGMTANSHGIACAQLAGIPECVLSRAREVVGFEDRGEPIQPKRGGRQGAGPLTLASPEVQEVLDLFINPPDGALWKDASEELVSNLLKKVQNSSGGAINVFRMDSESQEVFELALDQDQLSREKKATVRPTADIEGLVSLTLEEAFRGKNVSVTVQRRVRQRLNLIDSLLQSAADEQEARAGGETGGKGNTAPDAAPAPPASSMAPDALPSASSKAFFAPPRRHEKVKTGNFRLTVDVLPHPVFSRGDGGADLYTSVAISLEEALVGFTRKITAIDETVVVLRRTSRTLPGMVLRFPGLGMPIPVPSGRKRPSACAGNTKSASPSVEPASTVAEANAIVDTLRATTGAVAGQDQEEECDVGASGGETAAFGDLFVEVSVTLPAGMRDDRSKLIGTFLKAGSDEAREEEEGEREGIEGDKSGGWRGTRRGSKRRQKRTKPEEVAQETV
eukprot:g11267.t1